MHIRNRLMLALLGAGALAIAPTAHAQEIARTDPVPAAGETAEAVEQEASDLVRACVERMATITRHTCERIVRLSWDGITRMRMLAREGAPDPVIAGVARETLERMARAADEGRDRVNRTARECLGRLKEMEARPIHAAIILEARERSLGVIATCLRESAQRVRRALRFLTSDATPGSPIVG